MHAMPCHDIGQQQTLNKWANIEETCFCCYNNQIKIKFTVNGWRRMRSLTDSLSVCEFAFMNEIK